MTTFPNIKSKRHTIIAFVFGILITSLYKVWKWNLRSNVGLSPTDDYFQYEMLSTVFRFIGAISCIYMCIWAYKDKKELFSFKASSTFWLFTTNIAGFLFLKVFVYGASFSLHPFLEEFFINLNVGFFEEFAFRGLVFASLFRLVGPTLAALFSAVYFSVWHFDVYEGYMPFIFLFLSGLLYACFYYLGISLLVLSIGHFLWDLIHFVLIGTTPNGLSNMELIIYQMLFLWRVLYITASNERD